MFDAVSNVMKMVFGDANEREIRKIQPLVARIAELESRVAGLDDAALAAQTVRFRERLDRGEPLDDLLPEAFATVREAGKRVLNMRHFDCQMIGGTVIHQGKIAEMRTGEGKTLVATLPVYLNALPGKGVHLVTVNDYLAARDADWMARIYNFLGLSVGKVLSSDRNAASKRAAYLADITYGTNNEFGFDYLRDNMKYRVDDYVQRGHHFAIVDEVDSILVDEARTPLIISGPTNQSVDLYNVVDAVVPLLIKDMHFTLDEKARSVQLTEEGIAKVEEKLHVDNLYDPANIEILHHAMAALRAHHLYKRDRDYVVRDGDVVIVDEFTGRLMAGRRWSDGLHQAIEAKEKVAVQEESQTYATITYQNYYRMYTKLAGMTGTAATEAAEFAEIYKLDVVAIPTNRPVARKDVDDVVYKNQAGKFRAVVEEIKRVHQLGQPVLVGTTSVEKSALVARMLEQAGVPHEVLNAKQHDREATIVAQAGRVGAVTISTNMAGRGTDIRLGGNPEEMALHELQAQGHTPETAPEVYAQLLAEHTRECAAEAERVRAAGGLHILGTERHESRRVDNQLRGRAGRQGDPGSSRFFVALDDPLMRMFGSDRITKWMERMGLQEDEAIEHRMVTSSIEGAQKKVEAHHFGIRKNLIEYDDVMNYQRKGVYDLRRRALESVGIREMVLDSVDSVCGDIVDDYAGEGLSPNLWNVQGIRENLQRVFGVSWSDTDQQVRDMARVDLEKRIRKDARAAVEARAEKLGDQFEPFARMLILRSTDDLWRGHLLAIDRLRQGVGIRGYGQRNPLLEYKREAYQMFLMMSAARDEQVVTALVHREPAPAPVARSAPPPMPLAVPVDAEEGEPLADSGEVDGAPTIGLSLPDAPVVPMAPRRPAAGDEARAFAVEFGIQRNDPCPCGSGQKFKKCCAKGGEDAAAV